MYCLNNLGQFKPQPVFIISVFLIFCRPDFFKDKCKSGERRGYKYRIIIEQISRAGLPQKQEKEHTE